MCVLSSRAVQLGVLGKAENGGEGWCEYEMEEGSGAGLHNISVTKETYALGMAVDFTSLKSFTHKGSGLFMYSCIGIFMMILFEMHSAQ